MAGKLIAYLLKLPPRHSRGSGTAQQQHPPHLHSPTSCGNNTQNDPPKTQKHDEVRYATIEHTRMFLRVFTPNERARRKKQQNTSVTDPRQRSSSAENKVTLACNIQHQQQTAAHLNGVYLHSALDWTARRVSIREPGLGLPAFVCFPRSVVVNGIA